MKTRTAGLAVVGLAGLLTVAWSASGQAGIIGVIERVVFEPSAEAPERVQVWGAFTIAQYVPSQGFTRYYGPGSRGYLYFTLPADRTRVENARRAMGGSQGRGRHEAGRCVRLLGSLPRRQARERQGRGDQACGAGNLHLGSRRDEVGRDRTLRGDRRPAPEAHRTLRPSYPSSTVALTGSRGRSWRARSH